MIKSLAFVAVSSFVAGAFAQDPAGEPSPSSSANPPTSTSLIPAGISAQCNTYLTNLDSATDVSNCLNRLVEATAAFNPSNGEEATSEALSTALGAICSAQCDENRIRAQLASFYSACREDLVGATANPSLVTMYDVLYILTPLRNAVCAKNPETGNYCVQEIEVIDSENPTGGAAAKAVEPGTGASLFVEKAVLAKAEGAYVEVEIDDSDYPLGIFKRQDEGTQSPIGLLPNTTEYRETGLIYLFVSPTLTPQQLCTACTKEVLSAYVKFEASTPYAMGITQSPILGDQLQLWNNVTEKCGTQFTGEIMALSGVNQDTNAPVINAASIARMTFGGVLSAIAFGLAGMFL